MPANGKKLRYPPWKKITGPLTIPRLSNASQSPVPVGNSPMLRHFHSPTPSVNRLHNKYTTFCNGRVVMDFAEAAVGANGANAVVQRVRKMSWMTCAYAAWYSPVLIAAMFLNGLMRSINTIPMLKICTPPPDIYNMKACIGNDLAGLIAKSHARFSFSFAYGCLRCFWSLHRCFWQVM